MMGLTREERDLLRELASPDPGREIANEHEEEIHARLVERGLARTWMTHNFEPNPGAVPDEEGFIDGQAWDTQHWAITDEGRLALRVCTVTP